MHYKLPLRTDPNMLTFKADPCLIPRSVTAANRIVRGPSTGMKRGADWLFRNFRQLYGTC